MRASTRPGHENMWLCAPLSVTFAADGWVVVAKIKRKEKRGKRTGLYVRFRGTRGKQNESPVLFPLCVVLSRDFILTITHPILSFSHTEDKDRLLLQFAFLKSPQKGHGN